MNRTLKSYLSVLLGVQIFLFVPALFAAPVISEKRSGGLYIPNSKGFEYSPGTKPLIECRGREALVFVNGGLKVLNVDSLELLDVKGAEGFALDGSWGVVWKGDVLYIANRYDGDDAELPASKHYSFRFQEMGLKKEDGDPGQTDSPWEACDLDGGDRLEAVSDGLRIFRSTGPPIAELKRRQQQEHALGGLEFVQQSGIEFQENPIAAAFAVEGLIATAKSPDEEVSLLRRVEESKAGAGAKAYALCTEAARFSEAGDSAQAASAYSRIRALKPPPPGMDGADVVRSCRSLTGSAAGAYPIDLQYRYVPEEARPRCRAEHHLRTTLLPRMYEFLEAKKRTAAFLSGKDRTPATFENLLLLDYLAKSLLEGTKSVNIRDTGDGDTVVALVQDIISDDRDSKDFNRRRLETTVDFLRVEREELRRSDPALLGASVYGPSLLSKLDELRSAAEQERGAFRFSFEKRRRECW